MRDVVFTIGHSSHPFDHFAWLLKEHHISAICDVRSTPYSRVHSQFNRENLHASLKSLGIKYVFLGKELGARSDDPSCYLAGKVQYDMLARTDLFRTGLERVQQGMKDHHIALMCAERDPLECHRTILVARHLAYLHISIHHILDDGRLESHGDAMTRLLNLLRLPAHDLFRSGDELIEQAYKVQGERIAWIRRDVGSPGASSQETQVQ